MNTDSFIHTIHTHDFYNEISKYIADYFDISEYPIDNPLQSDVNIKKIGYDENDGRIMREFIGLKSKMYSIRTDVA